jgi:hypothetical protein
VQVYDVTKFLEDHPGGPEIMMEHAGEGARLRVAWVAAIVCARIRRRRRTGAHGATAQLTTLACSTLSPRPLSIRRATGKDATTE